MQGSYFLSDNLSGIHLYYGICWKSEPPPVELSLFSFIDLTEN